VYINTSAADDSRMTETDWYWCTHRTSAEA